MKYSCHPLLLLACLCPAATASDLDLTVRSGGQSVLTVVPGETVDYEVIGELTDALNEGLAMFSFDLAFEGGSLPQASAPAGSPMSSFAGPLGITNPAGFGGTPAAGSLAQVGGAQNSIRNTLAPAPIGNVLTGVAALGSPEVLVTGTLAAPMKVGTFTLSISNVMANVIRPGETGIPFWKVEAAGAGSVIDLQIQVVALTADVSGLSISSPGTQTMTIDAGLPSGGRDYLLLGSITGTAPGFTLSNGHVLPLMPDPYFVFTLTSPNTFPLAQSSGQLDPQGRATASFTLPPGIRPAAIGVNIYHAYVLTGPLDFASNAVAVVLTP